MVIFKYITESVGRGGFLNSASLYKIISNQCIRGGYKDILLKLFI